MKRNLLLFYFIVFMYGTTAAFGGIISSPSQLSLVTPGEDVIINNGGTYSLQNLDSTGANTITIDFTMGGGGSNPDILLVADSGFDGTLNVQLINEVDNLQIKLTEDFLAEKTSDEVLRLINFSSSTGYINVFSENTSEAYNYGICTGGTDWCVIRTNSTTYTQAQQNAVYERLVASIGVQNNPKILLQPMIVINQHELLDYYEFSDELFISVIPEYYKSKNFHNTGIRLNSGTKIGGRLLVGISAYAIKTNFENAVSDFKSNVYGGNLRFNYALDEVLFLRGVGGISFSNIDCDNIKKSNSVVNNPTASGIYGGLDFGAKFNFESGLYLSPFVGYDMRSERVVDVHQNESFAHFGNDIGFKYFMDGVSYDYILRVGINSQGYLDAGANIGIWTVSDKIGGSVSIGILDTDFGWSGKVAANVKFAF